MAGVRVRGSCLKWLFLFPKRMDDNPAWKCYYFKARVGNGDPELRDGPLLPERSLFEEIFFGL